ncbi:Coatomer subunit zeta-2, partial [Varanus komodoensis]
LIAAVEGSEMQKGEARPRQPDHLGGAARGQGGGGGGERAERVPAGVMEVPAGLMLEPSLYTIKAIFILDSFGQRLLAKYYDDMFPSMKEQKCFEKNVFKKTHKTDSEYVAISNGGEQQDCLNYHPEFLLLFLMPEKVLIKDDDLNVYLGEIAFLEGLTIVYKSSIDLFFYVVGSPHENELMLMSVLTCLFETLNHMLRKNVEKRTLVENMDAVFLVVDEIVDGGVILESDPQQVIQKLNFRMNPEPAAYGFVLFDYITGNSEHSEIMSERFYK